MACFQILLALSPLLVVCYVWPWLQVLSRFLLLCVWWILCKKSKKHCLESSIRAKEAYHAYFDIPVGDQGKRWAPHVICEYCRRTLESWFRGEKRAMPFAFPPCLAWALQPSNRLLLLYGRPKQNTEGKNAPSIKYPDIPSSIAPVLYNTTDFPVPQPPLRDESSIADMSYTDSETKQSSAMCVSTPSCWWKVSLLPQPRRYQWSCQGTVIDKVECWATYFQTEAMGLAGWQCSNYFTEKATLRLLGVQHIQGWVLLLPWYRRALPGYGHFLQSLWVEALHRQLISKPQSCFAAQHEQVSFHSFSSFSSHEGRVSEHQNLLERIKVRPL